MGPTDSRQHFPRRSRGSRQDARVARRRTRRPDRGGSAQAHARRAAAVRRDVRRRRDALARVGPLPARRSPPARTGRCRHGPDDARPAVGRGRARPAGRQDRRLDAHFMLDVDVGAPEQGHAGLEIHVGRYWTEGSAEGWAPLLDALVALGLADRERAEAAITLPGLQRTRRAGIRHQSCQDRSGRRRAALREALSRRGPRPRGDPARGWRSRSHECSHHARAVTSRSGEALDASPRRRACACSRSTAGPWRTSPRCRSRSSRSATRSREHWTPSQAAEPSTPSRTKPGLAPGRPQAAFTLFVGALERAGVLQDPETPDPIHELCPDGRRTASLYLFPTNRCNLGCVYCYASSGPAGGPPLSEHDAAVAIDRFFDDLAPEVAARLAELPRGRRADRRARRDAIGVAALP